MITLCQTQDGMFCRCNSATRSFTYALVTCHFLFTFLFILTRLVLSLVSSHQLSFRVTGSHLSFLSPPRCAKTSAAETNEKIIFLALKFSMFYLQTPKVLQLKTQMEAAAAFALQVCGLFYWTAVNTLLAFQPQLKISFGVGKKNKQNQLKM